MVTPRVPTLRTEECLRSRRGTFTETPGSDQDSTNYYISINYSKYIDQTT